jgi:hypothetical protein
LLPRWAQMALSKKEDGTLKLLTEDWTVHQILGSRPLSWATPAQVENRFMTVSPESPPGMPVTWPSELSSWSDSDSMGQDDGGMFVAWPPKYPRC